MDKQKPRVLVVDDDPQLARMIQRALARRHFDVESICTPDEVEDLVRRARTDDWDAILLDVNIGSVSGLDVLARLREGGNRSAIVMLTADDSAATATAALRGGAFHYIVKPPQGSTLVDIIDLAVRHTAIHRDLALPGADDPAIGPLLGRSDAMADLRRMVPRIAEANVSVLIIGESGTGKEVVARALHQASPRSRRPFVPLNCGAIPEGLIDSELFGHTRGAFTGATSARPGVFVEADGGTLFLDEIGDMPLAVQARLLRALQEREVRAVGSDGARAVDVRVIAATNVDLGRAVQDGKFRADLYFRLNVVNLRVPPLRERPEDIPALIAALLQRHAGERRRFFDDDALDTLVAYAWPGNVRELENAILHALAMTREGTIDLAALPGAITTTRRMPRLDAPSVPEAQVDRVSLTDTKRRAATETERNYLTRLLEQTRGSISAAARIASIDRTNFRRLLQRHNIDASKFKT